MSRYLRTVPADKLTPSLILAASCGYTMHLHIGEEVQIHHFGEDGPQPVLVDLRGPMFIDSFESFSSYQGWYADELAHQHWLSVDEATQGEC